MLCDPDFAASMGTAFEDDDIWTGGLLPHINKIASATVTSETSSFSALFFFMVIRVTKRPGAFKSYIVVSRSSQVVLFRLGCEGFKTRRAQQRTQRRIWPSSARKAYDGQASLSNHPPKTYSGLWKIFRLVCSLRIELVSRVCARLLIVIDVHSLARASNYLGCCRHTDRGVLKRVNMTGVTGIPVSNGKQHSPSP